MKHKQFGFLHLMCGKQGEKGKRKLSVELSYQNTPSVYLFGFSIRLIFFFFSAIIEIEKKQEVDYGKYVSQETADDDSV